MQQAPQMRDGGAMTGQYMIEKPNVQNPVAELEVDEYVKRPDGVIQKVEGETHENGGVLVDEEQLPDGSQIVSDHREVGDKARDYSKLLGVKIKPTDTFASVIEKREKQIGLTKIVEEQEEILAKLKKQTDKLVLNPEKESTLRLNIDMLQRQFNEKEQEKEPLKAQVAEIFNMTFQDQEVEKMEDGGDMVIGYAKKYKIDPERAKQLVSTYLNGGEHLPKYQDGGRQDEMYKQAVGLGYSGANDITTLQQWYAKNYTNEIVKYFNESGQPLTAKHVDILKQRNPDVFRKTEIGRAHV
jgi:hypothetical protein